MDPILGAVFGVDRRVRHVAPDTEGGAGQGEHAGKYEFPLAIWALQMQVQKPHVRDCLTTNRTHTDRK